MRDCKNCKHLIMYDYKNKSYSCEKWECKFEPKEQEPTTKNDLGVDLISRADAIKAMQEKSKKLKNLDTINGLCGAVAILYDMPSITPQEPILDKVRAQIKSNLRGVEIALEVLVENHPLRSKMEGAKDTLEECLELIDKAESEGKK